MPQQAAASDSETLTDSDIKHGWPQEYRERRGECYGLSEHGKVLARAVEYRGVCGKAYAWDNLGIVTLSIRMPFPNRIQNTEK